MLGGRGVAGEGDPVEGQRGEVIEQGAQAVHGEMLLDLAAVGLASDSVADPVSAAQLRAGPADDASDLLEDGFGGLE